MAVFQLSYQPLAGAPVRIGSFGTPALPQGGGMPGFTDALVNLASGIGQAGLSIGTAFAARELGLLGQPQVFTGVPQMPLINAQQARLLSPGALGGALALGGLGALTDLGLPFIDVVGQGIGQITEPFRRTAAGASPQPYVTVNPVSGRTTWFKPAGRPVLWSGDLSAARRVRKVAARARRRLGGR